MAEKFGKIFTSKDKLTHEALNAAFRPVYAELEAVKAKRADYEAQITLFNSEGIKRVAEAVKPLVDQLSSAIDGGLLNAQTDDLVAIVEGQNVDFLIPETARVAFRPTPFLAVMAPDVREDWAVGRVLVYNDDTGLLTVEILHLNGSGAERTGWTVAASSGVVEAVSQWVDEITAVRDQVVAAMATVAADKATVATDKATVLGYKNAAAQSVTDAADEVTEATYQAGIATAQAGIATTKAAEAAASAASIAGGPVASVNGRNGIVTGLAEAADVYSKTAADARYPLISNTGSAAALAADVDGTLGANSDDRVPTQKAVRTLVDPLVPAIGDIRYSHTDPGPDYLKYDNSIYLKSAYPALSAVLAQPMWPTGSPSRTALSVAGQVNAIAWSPDGRYCAFAHNTTPFVSIFDFSSGTPVKIANPATLPTSAGKGVSWTPDGRYLAVSHDTAPKITVYDFNTGSPIKIADPATAVGGTTVEECAWSSDGRYLAICISLTPFVDIYDFQTGSLVKTAAPASLPPAACTDVAWSPDNRYMAMACTVTPFVLIYDWQTGVPVKMADPAALPVGSGTGVAWSPDGRLLSVTANTGTRMYDMVSGVPVSTTSPAGAQNHASSFSPDGNHIAFVQQAANYVTFWERNGVALSATWGNITAPTDLPTNPCYAVEWSPTQKYVAVGSAAAPYAVLYTGYNSIGYNPDIEFKLLFEPSKWVKKS